jgi:hypothetical protein
VRRPRSEKEIARLRSLAGRYPTRGIAAELGRGVFATMAKTHQLRLSLSVKSKAGEPFGDPGPAGFEWVDLSEPVTRDMLIQDQD